VNVACDAIGELSEGAMRWLGRNLHLFDPFSPWSPLPEDRKVKAALELAIFCHSWAKLRPATDLLDEATALIQTIWQRPEFPLLIDAQSGYASAQRLVYAALAPAEVGHDQRGAALAQLKADGYLSQLGKSPYLRLEARYYADKAGVEHDIESYRELAEQSLLAKPPDLPMSRSDAYTITHTVFYLSDYGFRDPDLPSEVREQGQRLTCSILDSCVSRDKWDLAGELVITLACLGGNPTDTPSGQAGVRCLALAQLPNGAIPGRSASVRAEESLSPAEFFSKAYHTTLVTALMSLIVR